MAEREARSGCATAAGVAAARVAALIGWIVWSFYRAAHPTPPNVSAFARADGTRGADLLATNASSNQIDSLRKAIPWATVLGTSTTDFCYSEIQPSPFITFTTVWSQADCRRTTAVYMGCDGDLKQRLAQLLPTAPARVLDVGAGTGRDAAALAARGHRVVAVEPVRELREVAQGLHPDADVRWVEDSLPELSRLDGTFEVILLSAVWMHLPPDARGRAMERLAALLASSGLLIVSLRRGPAPPDRVMFDIPAAELVRDTERVGLRVVRIAEEETDHLGRAEVWWQTVALWKDA